MAAHMALLAAAVGALRLVEMMSRPRAAFRFGYGLLAASALLAGVGLVAYATGWSFTNNALYATAARALAVAAALIAYGAFIGAGELIGIGFIADRRQSRHRSQRMHDHGDIHAGLERLGHPALPRQPAGATNLDRPLLDLAIAVGRQRRGSDCQTDYASWCAMSTKYVRLFEFAKGIPDAIREAARREQKAAMRQLLRAR